MKHRRFLASAAKNERVASAVIVCLDANVIIYYIERNPVWEPKVSARLRAIAAAGDSLAVSDAALLECLVGPFQSADSAAVTDRANNSPAPRNPSKSP